MKKAVEFFKSVKYKLLILLILISLLITSSTFAYWTNYVEGSETPQTTQAFTFGIGSYSINPSLFILSSEFDVGDTSYVLANIFTAHGNTHVFEEVFGVEWLNNGTYDTDNYDIHGDIQINYEIRLLNSTGGYINSNKYNKLIGYINLELDSNNPASVTMNNSIEQFGYTLSITEPTRSSYYDQLMSLTIQVVFMYQINGITYEVIVN